MSVRESECWSQFVICVIGYVGLYPCMGLNGYGSNLVRVRGMVMFVRVWVWPVFLTEGECVFV